MIPWCAREAEAVLTGAPANDQTFRATADAAIGDPFTVPGTAFKVELADVTPPGPVQAALVHATIAAGTITTIDTARAQAAPGVLTVITHENAPAMRDGPMTQLRPSAQFPLKGNRVLYHRQQVAIGVAQTREQATSASRLVEPECDESEATSASAIRWHRSSPIRGEWTLCAATPPPRRRPPW